MNTQLPAPAFEFPPLATTDETRRTLRTALDILRDPHVRRFVETPHIVYEDFLGEREGELVAPDRLVPLNALVLLKERLGPRPDFIEREIARCLNAVEAFVRLRGDGPVALISCPARIEICGGHIDYIDYFQDKVLAFGSREYNMILVARPRDDRKVTAISLQEGFPPVAFSIDEFPVSASRAAHTAADLERVWLEYLDGAGYQGQGWENYVKSGVFFLQHLKPELRIRGMDLVVDSSIPVAGGASSSSALVTSTAYAARLFNSVAIDPGELAVSCGKAEWYVGTRGGNMDHATMAFSREHHAVRITFQPFDVHPVPMPTAGYRWITFFTTAAAKTTGLIVKDSEISAVSTVVIPLLIDQILAADAALEVDWNDFNKVIEANDCSLLADARKRLDRLVARLPETVTFADLKRIAPGAHAHMALRFPKLYEARGEEGPIPVRSLAKFHLDEIVRVLEEAEHLALAARRQVRGDPAGEAKAMREVGLRMNATHAGLRDEYGVGADEVEEVCRIAREADGVLGARVMGFGLGGNVLALVKEDRAAALVQETTEAYYRKHGRPDSGLAKDICVHTPGPGIGAVDFGNASRRRLIELTADWERWSAREKEIVALALGLLRLEAVGDFVPPRPVKPVVFAGGKGSRAKLDRPKVLAEVLGRPSLLRVLDTIASLSNVEKPLLIISNHKGYDKLILDAIGDSHDVDYLVETAPQGTGHAMLQAEEALDGFDGTVLVTEGVQAAMRKTTLVKSLLVHEALARSAMTMPTTRKERPYAYLVRDEAGMVCDSRETHLEQAEIIDYGEDNVSLYLVRSDALFPALHQAKARMTDPATGGYKGGALGFPNEMVRSLGRMGELVAGLCMADPREAKSIKFARDIPALEEHIRLMEAEGIY